MTVEGSEGRSHGMVRLETLFLTPDSKWGLLPARVHTVTSSSWIGFFISVGRIPQVVDTCQVTCHNRTGCLTADLLHDYLLGICGN